MHVKRRYTDKTVDAQTQKKRYVEHLVLAGKPLECEACGFDKPKEILHVHHKDRNRENGVIANLILLCPNCHETEHFYERDGSHSGDSSLVKWWDAAIKNMVLLRQVAAPN